MVANKKEFALGAGMMGGFIIVFILLFMPVINGHNAINYLDGLFNSISKGSAYYIPSLREEVQAVSGKQVDLELTLPSEEMAMNSRTILSKNEIPATVEGAVVHVQGGLAKILDAALQDSDNLFHNEGDILEAKYGIERRPVLYTWWNMLKSTQKALNDQELFKEAKITYSVMTKAVETAYNYYKIVPENMSDKVGMVILALVFYVVYTVWYGYAILFMFEGWGLKIGH